MINNKAYLEDQIKALKGKIHASTQEILTKTGNNQFKEMKMAAIWELMETVIIPIITYGSESWEPKKEMTQIEAIFNKTLKTILQLPDLTPTSTLLAEAGFIPIELVVKKKKTMQANRVLTKEKMGLIQLTTKDKSLRTEGIKNYKKNTVHWLEMRGGQIPQRRAVYLNDEKKTM